MQIQKGLVKYKDRTDIVCTYGLTEEGKQYYFLDNTSMTNGNIIASTVLVEAIDPVVVASSIGVIDQNGKEIIPFENKSIKVIGDNLLLVEILNSATPSVVEANNMRSDPLAATKLVTTSAAIKDKFNSKMGSEGRFVFNDQFSEATVCDFNGNNIIDNQYFSFIAIKNDRLYFSKNTAESPVLEYSLTEHKFVVEEVNQLDVQNTSITQETIDAAMETEENVSNFVANDITAKDFEEEPLPVEPTVVENPEVNVSENEEVVEETEGQQVEEPANEDNEEPLPVVPEENSVSVEQEMPEEASNIVNDVAENVENSVIDPTQMVENANVEIEDNNDLAIEGSVQQGVEDVVANNSAEDTMMAFDFKDNIDYSVNVDAIDNDISDGVPETSVTEFSDDLFAADLDNDIFADSALHVDKIDIDDNFNALSYEVRGKDSIIEDVASTMSNLISLNRSQKQTIAEYEEKLESAVSSYKKVVEKARMQIRDVETLKSRLKNYETIVTKLEAKIHILENKVHDQERVITSQNRELDSLRPQVQGKEELVRILADAQNLLEQNV